ncbi:MAG: hypothetical protein IPP94_03040 [Ignavibacteria bacterium]|nr:hypothetical protein [Ignavibacteria bacterium]
MLSFIAIFPNIMMTHQPMFRFQAIAAARWPGKRVNKLRAHFCFTICPFLLLMTLVASCSKDAPVTPPVVEPVQPVDTTSHDFRWEVTYLENSDLRDVFAINDSDVWAVGKLIPFDSTGQPDDANRCGAAHWDGTKWSLVTIPTVNSSGQVIKMWIEGVFAFAPNDVWMTSYANSYAHWDGKEWRSAFIKEASGGLRRIFGFSPRDIYFAGSGDIILHWDGNSFTRTQSGFKYPYEIMDMWGVEDAGEKELWAIARVPDQLRSAILVYRESTGKWETVWSNEFGQGSEQPYNGTVYTLYPYSVGNYFLAVSSWTTETVFEKREGDGSLARTSHSNLYSLTPFRMRGSRRNNVFVVGDRMLMAHFNGSTWKVFRELGTNYPSPLKGLSVLPNSVFAVGYDATRGILVRGERIK